MFDNLRSRIAIAIHPEIKQAKALPVKLAGFFSPGQPIYTDITIRKATREGYKWSTDVYSAVRTIIKAASGIPWIVLDADGELIPNHPFELLMRRPNPYFSGQDLMEFVIAHLKLVGNALWQPIIVNGQLRELWTVMPDMVRPIPSKVQDEWLEGWEVQDAEGKLIKLPPETFIHFMQFDPGNPYWGMGDLQAAGRTVDTDNEAQDTQKISMQNRGTPDGYFETETITDIQYEEAERRIKERYLDKSKRRAPWVIAGGKWHQMALNAVEMDFIQSRLQNKRAIASVFGLDAWWLGDREHSTYNNVIEARKALYVDVIIPLLDDIMSTMNLKIAPMYKEGITIAYNTSTMDALREDYGKKVEQAYRLWSMGTPFKQVNEKLELGFVEFPGWDIGYLPMMLLPQGSSKAEKMQTKALNLDTEEKKTIHWKRIDQRRVGWWGVVSKKVKSLYDAEGTAIIETIKSETPKQLIKAANRAIESLQPEWEKMLTAIAASLIENFGNEIAGDLGGEPSKSEKQAKWVFNPFKPSAKRWIADRTAKSITTILDTNKADIKVIIMKGIMENQTTPQIAKQIREFYDDRSSFKAMRVARTEVGAASSFGNLEAARQSGVVKTKRWLSSRDDRVRDSHVAMDGEEVNLDGTFSNGCEAPGIGDDPAETIMCRCVLQFGTR